MALVLCLSCSTGVLGLENVSTWVHHVPYIRIRLLPQQPQMLGGKQDGKPRSMGQPMS
jgi:hypothetical protein